MAKLRGKRPKRILVVDIGGTHVKILATGHKERRRFPSGPGLTPRQMVRGVKELAADWEYDAVSMGYPGPVRNGRPAREPYNIGRGWLGFDFEAAFGRPVKIINDAAMQALGSYRRGTMLFLGLGTGLGSAMVVNGTVVPLELGHLAVEKKTFEDFLGAAAFEKYGRKKWQSFVERITERLVAAFQIDDVVLGGGNVKRLTTLPKGCRAGDNSNAFLGGYRLWERPRP
ncbi:MAG TPA: ROK family protein [Thermoanaerobaculia bacterium]|nr:ROK family protein [Thermoanaerobaculia bacterium]